MLSKLPRQRPNGANCKGAECGTEYQRDVSYILIGQEPGRKEGHRPEEPDIDK